MPSLGVQARCGGESEVNNVLNASLGIGKGTHGPRGPGPTPYLGCEGKKQQQRARRRRHRAQSLILQPQHVHKAPLSGDPQPGQHLRRGDKAARPAETGKWWGAGPAGTTCAPTRAWEESPTHTLPAR